MSEKTWEVEIELKREAVWTVEIEAETEDEAIELAKSNVWADDYDYEERAASSIIDENYIAEEQEYRVQCEICHTKYSNLEEKDAQGFRLVSKFEESEQVIYQP